MPTLNKGELDAASKGYQTAFNMAFEKVKAMWPKVAMFVPSSKKSEVYTWLGNLGNLREWIGERQMRDLEAFDFTIKNKKFELTHGVPADDFEDDNLGVHMPKFNSMGAKAARHPDKLVFSLLTNGFTQKGFDGVAFFHTAHPNGTSTYSNKGTAALGLTSYGAGRASIQALADKDGEPLDILLSKENTYLVVPPQLEKTALEILTAETLNNNTNPFRDSAQLVVAPRLSSNSTAWFILVDWDGLYPLVYQERRKPKFITKDAPTDDNVFWEGNIVYGVDYRGNAGYGLPQLAYGSTGTT